MANPLASCDDHLRGFLPHHPPTCHRFPLNGQFNLLVLLAGFCPPKPNSLVWLRSHQPLPEPLVSPISPQSTCPAETSSSLTSLPPCLPCKSHPSLSCLENYSDILSLLEGLINTFLPELPSHFLPETYHRGPHHLLLQEPHYIGQLPNTF